MKIEEATDSGIRWTVMFPGGAIGWCFFFTTREEARKQARFLNEGGVQGEFSRRRRYRAVKVRMTMRVIGRG